MAAPVRSRFRRVPVCFSRFASNVLLYFVLLIEIILTSKGSDQRAPSKLFTKPLHVVDDKLVYFEVIEPATLRYIYTARPARNFGLNFNQSYASVELLIADPSHGCSRLHNDGGVRGNSVLITRGQCSFVSKAITAEQAGALFVIITDDDEGSSHTRIDMVEDGTGRKVHIPALFISGKDGAAIKKELGNMAVSYALINIPVNLTAVPLHKRNHPPWTLW